MAGFLTPLRVEIVDHIAHDGQGEWRLLAPLVFEDESGRRWTVPEGFLTDFASVPRAPLAYMLTGNTAHAPAVLHDWAIRTQACPREEADELFRQAMVSIGMPAWRVGMMYRAVAAYTRNLRERGHWRGPEDNSGFPDGV